MEREYKFRAWDSYQDTIHYSVESGIYEDPDEIISFDKILELACYEVMQYTGLNDRVNQKEIYECDVVKALHRNYDNEDDWRERFQTFRVTYLNGCYMFGDYNAHEFLNKFIYTEVVGDQYTTPELWESAL